MTIPFSRTSFPEMYEQSLVGPLFQPWAELLLDAAAPAPGEHVLDVACGTGIVARLARERMGSDGRVVGVDASPAMLAVARRVAPSIDWRDGEAAALPLQKGERFDVVLCQQGLQFFADRDAAAREMHRALVPGGRVAVSTWLPDDRIPLCGQLRQVAERHLGPITDRRHSFGDGALLEALLRDAGFRDVRSREVTHTIRFEDGAAFLRLNAMALLGMSPRGPDLDEEERGRLLETISRECATAVVPYGKGRTLTFELGANLATARRE